MQLLLAFTCLTVLGSAVAESSEPHYLVTVPDGLRFGSTQKACLAIQHLKGPANLKLQLEDPETLEIKLEVKDKIDGPDYSHCYELQVPKINDWWVQWNFNVLIDGENFHVNDSKKVRVYPQNHGTFIHLDKPMYKPGQTVSFRVVSLDLKLHAVNEKIPLVEILDPKDNRIAQWKDVSPIQGFVDLSFPLADEIPLGDYQIRVNKQESKSFSVSEYVLKKFDLKVNLPEKVTPKDESFVLEVCGSYTFGKPVHGSLDIYVCEYPTNPLEQHEEDTSACQHIHGAQTDNKGCFTTKVDLGFFNLTVTTYIRRLLVAAALKEQITGLVEKGEAELEIGTLELISFVDFESFYFRGLPFTGIMKVTDTSNEPSKKQTVYLIVNNDDVKTNISLVTDEKGIAPFTLDTSEWKDMVVISGAFSLEDTDNEHEDFFYTHTFAYRWLKPFYSDSNSYLKVETLAEKWPCDKEQPIKVEYHINKNELDPDSNHLSFFYIVRGREGINSFGEHKEEIKAQDNGHTLHGSFSLKFAANNDLYPTAQVLVFTVLRSGGMAGDKSFYRIPACFKSKVQLEFSEKVVEPRGKVNLEIRGEPGSFCSVRSVDKGLLHHRAHDPNLPILDEDDFQNHFIYVALYSSYLEDDTCPGSHSADVSYQQEADVYQLFMTSGLMVFSNAKIKKPVICNTTEFTARSSAGGLPAIKDSAKKEKAKKPAVRTWFPETWLYDLVSIGPDSKATLKLTTPDSITNWATDAFCFGESGYGEAEEVDLTVLKSYFIDLTLPHSAVQGETFPVTAVAHNYLDSCIVVAASLSESSDFKAEAVTKEDFRCICADQSAGFTWNITASKIGDLKLKVNSGALKVDGDCTGHHERLENEHLQDFLEKNIRIKPSGVEEDHTETYRLCPKDESVRQEVSLKIPENVVKGSERAYITVFGDLINIEDIELERMVNLPTGCGEQNMATFAANLYAMELINNTRHLTPKEEKTFLHSLTTGYQKQLNFKNENGSYSIFTSDSGDVWLTAFVIRCFGNARKYIYIDEKNLQDSLKWLSSLQKPDGCFEASTGYFNNRLEDDENHELAITAYIAISLMEYGLVHNTMLDNALSCLRNHADKTNHTYTEALLAYAFSLSGDNNLKQHILEDLETKAIKEGVLKHWDLPYAYSGGVETSACVLLSLLTGHPNDKDFHEASEIANWIARQQKAQGSFYSTQDTVAAFHALSKFTARQAHVEIDKVSVTVRSLSGFQKQLDVDKSRTDLQQKVSLPDIPGEYTVTAVGSGCVYVQSHLTYHAPPAKDQKFFGLSVKTRPSVCTYQEHESFDIMVEVSYSGNRVSSNMVIVEVELLTGFVPDKRSVALLIQNQHVKKTEITEEKVIIYLDELTHETQSLSFKIKEETHVDNLHPAAVLVYDYYEPEESAAVEYNSPCSSDPGHCNAEVSARKDCGHPGITREECLQKNCCYDTSVPDSKWCFYRTGHAGTR